MSLPAAPMLTEDHISVFRSWFHALVDLGSPASLFEDLVSLLALVQRLHMLPAVERRRRVLLVQSVIHRDLVGPSGGQENTDVLDRVRLRQGGGKEGVHLPFWVKKVIVRIDKNNGRLWGSGRHYQSQNLLDISYEYMSCFLGWDSVPSTLFSSSLRSIYIRRLYAQFIFS
jgi:hypothetical protein